MRHLRSIRASIALVILALSALGFLDFGRLLPALTKVAGRLQLVPALLALPARAAALLLLSILVVTLLLGRVYCSTVCPLGTMQDLFIRLRDLRGRHGRLRFRFEKASHRLQLGLALVAGALAAFGALHLLLLLEPFAGFGRILSALVRPLAALVMNLVAHGLSAREVYALSPVSAPPFSLGALLVAALSLLSIGVMSFYRGRLFCNLLCPAGALLGLLSRRPAIGIGIDVTRCNGCGLCERACKASCIDARARKVQQAACVVCFDCFTACPKGGVGLQRNLLRMRREASLARPLPGSVDPVRRAIVTAVVAGPAVLFASSALSSASDPRDARLPITPPGSRDRGRFTAHCTACHLCVAACPTGILRPSLVGYGLSGLLEPRLSYLHGACAPDCVRCAEVCPTGAIELLEVSEKHLTQIGRARFVKADCVVEVKRKACGACAEHCPTKAISMKPYGDPAERLRIPEVDEEACIGCGACEHPCPVLPRKAIWIEARSPHGRAKKIEQPPLESPKEGGFPF